MIATVVDVSLVAIAISIGMCFYRVWAGPTLPDRAIALDTIGSNVIALMVLFAIRTGSDFFFDSVLVIAILSFIGTVAISKYLAGGVVLDRDPR